MHQHQIKCRDKTKAHFLKEMKHSFAWDISDIPGIDPELITHNFNANLEFKHVKKKKEKKICLMKEIRL